MNITLENATWWPTVKYWQQRARRSSKWTMLRQLAKSRQGLLDQGVGLKKRIDDILPKTRGSADGVRLMLFRPLIYSV
jgi:hypothetical protein